MSERTVQRVGAKVVVRSIDNAGCTMRALTVTSKLRLQLTANRDPLDNLLDEAAENEADASDARRAGGLPPGRAPGAVNAPALHLPTGRSRITWRINAYGEDR